jgi:hypothetical protein
MRQGKYRLQEIKLSKCLPDEAPLAVKDPVNDEPGDSHDKEISLMNLTVKHVSTSAIRPRKGGDQSTLTSEIKSRSTLGSKEQSRKVHTS